MAIIAGCGFELPVGNPGGPGTDAGHDAALHVDAAIDAVIACPDSDHDTVCDAVDKCPGFDDRLDRDGDGIPDGCDDWQCGATKPTAPGDPLTFAAYGHSQIIGMTDIGGQGRIAQLTGVASVQVKVGWILDVDCSAPTPVIMNTTCRSQLELGFDPAGRFGCVLDKTLTSNQPDLNLGTVTATVPPPGLYSLRVNLARNPTGCGTGTTWTGTDPPAAQTVAYLCVY